MLGVGRGSARKLLLVIGANGVEGGAIVDGRWADESLACVRLAPAEPGQDSVGSLALALSQAEQMWGAWRDADDSKTDLDLDVIVADVWLALVCLPWAPSLRDPATAVAFARNQMCEAGYDTEPDDVIRLDDAPFGAPRLAVAYPAPLLASLQGLADRLRANLRTVLPLSVATWPLNLPGMSRGASRAMAVVDEGMILVSLGQRCLVQITVRRSADTLSGLRDLWRRMRFRDPGLASVGALDVLQLMAPAVPIDAGDEEFVAVKHDLDGGSRVSPRLQLLAQVGRPDSPLNALPPTRHRESSGRWLAAASVLALAAVACWQAGEAAAKAGTLRAEVEAMQSRDRAVPLSAMDTWTRQEKARVASVNAAIRDLNLPISGLLQALQPPRDIHVAVMGVDVLGQVSGAAASTLRITAQAGSGADMARYVAFVASRRPLTGAYLTRHEMVAEDTHLPYRFTLEATWSD